MKDRSDAFLLVFVGFFLGVVVVALVFSFVLTKHESRTTEPPRLAGQAVPANLVSINFKLRYDLYCKGQDDKSPVVFKNMAILGFTGNNSSKGKDDKFSSYDYSYFEKWLALQQSDKRKIFIPKESVLWFEEAKQ